MEGLLVLGELGALMQAHMDGQRYPVTKADLARRLGVTRQTVANWMAGTAMPHPEHIRALTGVLDVSYTRVLDAALADRGYLPKEREGHERPAAIAPARRAELVAYVEAKIADVQARKGMSDASRKVILSDLHRDLDALRAGETHPGSTHAGEAQAL